MNDVTEIQQRTLVIVQRHHKGSPITGAQIAAMISLTERDPAKPGADMRSVIHGLRVKGYPICATGNGYWYAKSQDELFQYITEFQARIDNQQEACDGLKNAFENVKSDYPQKIGVEGNLVLNH